MNYRSTLKKVAEQKISCDDAFYELYGNKHRTVAHFAKLRMNIKDSKLASFLVTTLFLIPTPVVIGKLFLKIFHGKLHLSEENLRLISYMLSHAKGAYVIVQTSDAHITIKMI